MAAFSGTEPDAFGALGYDTATLMMAAIQQAGSLETTAVQAALTGMGKFEGVTGNISFRSGGRIPTKSVTIVGVDGGKLNFVSELTPTAVPEP